MYLYIHPLRRPLCTTCKSFGIVPWQRRPVKPGSHLHLQDEMLRCPCRPQLIRHGFLGISDNKNVNTATTTQANTHANKHMLQNHLHWNEIVEHLKKRQKKEVLKRYMEGKKRSQLSRDCRIAFAILRSKQIILHERKGHNYSCDKSHGRKLKIQFLESLSASYLLFTTYKLHVYFYIQRI